MSERPLISVCLPVFNEAASIAATIRSVLAQQWDSLEIVVSDNASEDDTVAIVQSFDDPRMVVLQNPKNAGWAGNSNRALQAAQGDLIATLHARDTYRPGFLTRLAEVAEAHRDAGTLFFVNKKLPLRGSLSPSAYFSWAASLRPFPSPVNTVYRREALEGTRCYPDGYYWTAEARLSMEIAKKGWPALFIAEEYFDRSNGQENESHQTARRVSQLDEVLQFYTEFEDDPGVTPSDRAARAARVVEIFDSLESFAARGLADPAFVQERRSLLENNPVLKRRLAQNRGPSPFSRLQKILKKLWRRVRR